MFSRHEDADGHKNCLLEAKTMAGPLQDGKMAWLTSHLDKIGQAGEKSLENEWGGSSGQTSANEMHFLKTFNCITSSRFTECLANIYVQYKICIGSNKHLHKRKYKAKIYGNKLKIL